MPYEVRAEHDARKKAEGALVDARKEVRRLKVLLHNMLDKLKTVVEPLVDSISRNPDAMAWVCYVKIGSQAHRSVRPAPARGSRSVDQSSLDCR